MAKDTTTPFQRLFKTYREAARLSKLDVAHHIEKSEGYIRKIEDYAYTPPTYAVCMQLVKLFNLNASERASFLKQAFLERIKDNRDFFDELISEVKPYEGSSHFHDSQNNRSKCTYVITLEAKSNDIFNTNTMKATLHALLNTAANPNQSWILDLAIEGANVHITVDILPEANVHQWIQGIKTYTSGALKSESNTLSKYPSIWESTYTIYTIDTAHSSKKNTPKPTPSKQHTPTR